MGLWSTSLVFQPAQEQMLLFWFLFSLDKKMKSLHKVERQNLWSGIFYFFLVPNMWIPCMSCHFELWSVRLWIMVSWFFWEMWVGLVTDAFKFMEMCVHVCIMTAGSMVSVFGGGGVESWFRFEHTVAEVLESGSTILEFRRQGASTATLGGSLCSYTCYHRNQCWFQLPWKGLL